MDTNRLTHCFNEKNPVVQQKGTQTPLAKYHLQSIIQKVEPILLTTFHHDCRVPVSTVLKSDGM